jgi:acetate kinase
VRVLVVNAGSSSLKHALVDSSTEQILRCGEERWDPQAHALGRHAAALRTALADAEDHAHAVGHRIVHGGPRFRASVRVEEDVRGAIAALAPLDPLHTAAALEGIDAAREALPGLAQVACFDTAYHHTLPPEAATYALPRAWNERWGLRRYGFHGLNVQWCQERAEALLGAQASRRLVVCHLGSGCSVSAVLDGRSHDTTMGLTPLEGVPMATRSGSIDPGLLLYLLAQGIDPEQLAEGLNHHAGLLGLSGHAGGVHAIEQAAAAGEGAAALALAVFVRGVAGAIAAMAASLAGLDTLVFTAGAGEGSASLRAAVCARLAQLGIALDTDRNREAVADADIGTDGAAVRVLVVHAGEELVIARETARVLQADCPGCVR